MAETKKPLGVPDIPQFRRLEDGGWAVFGRSSQVKIGKVEVVLKSGEMRRVVVRVLGKPFLAQGIECVYGYLKETDKQIDPKTSPTPTKRPAKPKPRAKAGRIPGSDRLGA